MPLYTIEISHKQEEEIFYKYLCKMKDKYGVKFQDEINKLINKIIMEKHQFSIFMEFLKTKIDIDTKIKNRQDFYDKSTEDQIRWYRRVKAKTIIEQYYFEWYEKVWKSRLEPRLRTGDMIKYIRKEGTLVMENHCFLNVKKVKSSK